MITLPNLIKAALAILLLILITFIFFHSNPEKAVARIIQKGQVAIEKGNLKAVMSLVSLSYHDDLGFNYGALRGSFGYTFTEYKNLRAEYRFIGFKCLKDTSTVEIDVRVKGFWAITNQDTWIAGTGNEYERVFIVFKRENGRWKVISTKWPNRKDSLKMFSMLRNLYKNNKTNHSLTPDGVRAPGSIA